MVVVEIFLPNLGTGIRSGSGSWSWKVSRRKLCMEDAGARRTKREEAAAFAFRRAGFLGGQSRKTREKKRPGVFGQGGFLPVVASSWCAWSLGVFTFGQAGPTTGGVGGFSSTTAHGRSCQSCVVSRVARNLNGNRSAGRSHSVASAAASMPPIAEPSLHQLRISRRREANLFPGLNVRIRRSSSHKLGFVSSDRYSVRLLGVSNLLELDTPNRPPTETVRLP